MRKVWFNGKVYLVDQHDIMLFCKLEPSKNAVT